MGNKVFRQFAGISMQSDPVSFFDNLFLYHYKKRWIRFKGTDLKHAWQFANVFCFTDDLAALTDGGEVTRTYTPQSWTKKGT